MNRLCEKLKALFDYNANPVIGVRNGEIAFNNPAAASFFKKELYKMSAGSVLPQHILEDNTDNFVASAFLMEQYVTAACSRFEDVLVVSLSVPEKPDEIIIAPEPVITALRSSAMTIRLAADRMTARAESLGDIKLMQYSTMLFHSYYSLLRLTINLDMLGRLRDKNVFFSPRIVDITELCEDLIGSVRHLLAEKAVEFIFNSPRRPVYASVDREKLEQLILNLISNSVINAKEGGKVSVGVVQSGDNVILSVKDDGAGIPSDVLSSVFARWNEKQNLSQTASGPGLGLSIAKGIAELHGGAMLIGSKEGEGVSVRVTLPANTRTDMLCSPSLGTLDMNLLLREFSGILSREAYDGRYFD